MTTSRRDFLSLLAASPWLGAVGGGVSLVACKDKQKDLEKLVTPGLDALIPLTERDSKQVREGVPKAAEHIVKHLDKDPSADVEGLKRALTKTREEIKDLAFSKVTFFAYAGPDGVVLRSEAETDLAAGNSIIKAIEDTKQLFGDGAKAIETFGYMEGLRGVNKGNQLQWVVGSPVKRDGKAIGAVVAGWSLRLYAKYLDTHFIQAIEKTKEDPNKPNPLAYTFVVKGKQAFGSPDAPDVNMTMLGELDLPSKVQGDKLFTVRKEVESRTFLVGARKAPALGDDLFVACMLSAV